MDKFAMMQSIHSGIQKSAGIGDVVKQITDWYNASPQNRELTHGLLGGIGGLGLGGLFGGRRGALLGGLIGGGLGWGGTKAYNAGYMPTLRNYLQQFTQPAPRKDQPVTQVGQQFRNSTPDGAQRKAQTTAAVTNALKAPGSGVPAMIQKANQDLAAKRGREAQGAAFYNSTPAGKAQSQQTATAVTNALKAPGSGVPAMIQKGRQGLDFQRMVGRDALAYSNRVMAPINQALHQKSLQNQARVGSLYAAMQEANSTGDTATARELLRQINQLTETGFIGNPVTQGDRDLLKAPLNNQVRRMNREAWIADQNRLSTRAKNIVMDPARDVQRVFDNISTYVPALGGGLLEGAGRGAEQLYKNLQDSSSKVMTPIVENL